jgi:hyaluronan synthase
MAPALIWLIMTLCLLISIIKYTLGLILKWSVRGTKIEKDFTYQPTVSVLMPCYNEGRTVYETIASISKSNYPNDRLQVFAQDDCSADDSYQWMLKAQRDFTNIPVHVGRNAENSGKARTVCIFSLIADGLRSRRARVTTRLVERPRPCPKTSC